VSRSAGLGLVTFGLAYPVLSLSAGHAYPFTPTYGVPCPTTILTIGLLLTTESRPSFAGAAVPAIWGLIGGSAALLLGVWPDYILLAAGVGLLILLTRGWLSPARTDTRPPELVRVARH
jgi:hypothetical protein